MERSEIRAGPALHAGYAKTSPST